MSDLEFAQWRGWIEQRCGLTLAESRKGKLGRHLWQRMQLLGFKTYRDFYHHVNLQPGEEPERIALQDCLLNADSCFFRHPPSFAALTGHILPEVMRAKRIRGENWIAMWSAGCSTGQEPYSLAMTLLEQVGPASLSREGSARPSGSEAWRLVVLGTDVSRSSLEKARRGIYRPHEVRFMPAHYCRSYLERTENDEGIFYRVVQRVRSLVEFGLLNLNDRARYPIPGQDVVFCQNVLVHFEPQGRARVVQGLCERLRPGGFLVLAPADDVGQNLSGLRAVRLEDSVVYRRLG